MKPRRSFMDCRHNRTICLCLGFDTFGCFVAHVIKQGLFPQEVIEAAAYVLLGHDASTVAELLYQYKSKTHAVAHVHGVKAQA